MSLETIGWMDVKCVINNIKKKQLVELVVTFPCLSFQPRLLNTVMAFSFRLGLHNVHVTTSVLSLLICSIVWISNTVTTQEGKSPADGIINQLQEIITVLFK